MAECYLRPQLYLIPDQVNERIQLQLLLLHKQTIEQHQINICKRDSSLTFALSSQLRGRSTVRSGMLYKM